MKKLIALTLSAAFILTASSAFALSLKFENKSKWEIHELYFAPADEKTWGPDQLEDEVIEVKETFTLTKISKGNYDIKIVDEDGDVCEVADVDFRASEHFVLTDSVLLGCQAATAEESED